MALRSDGKFFFVFTKYYNIWQEDVAKIPKLPWAMRNVNPVRQ